MKLVSKICTAMMLCVVTACGGSSSNPPSNPTTDGNTVSNGNNVTDGNTTQGGSLSVLTVSGTVSNFAFDANALTDDTNNLQVGVLDPNNLYPNGTLQVVSATAIKAADCTTAAGVRSCKFSIANVDTSKYTNGLLVVTTDSRVSSATGDTTQWQTLATFVAPATLQAAQAKGTLAGVAAYDLSGSGHTAFASLAGGATSPVATTGAVIGLVTADGVTPVAGASVGSAVTGVSYPNADVTAANATAVTSANGLFLAVPASKTSSALTGATVTGANNQTWAVPALPAVSPLWMVVSLTATK